MVENGETTYWIYSMLTGTPIYSKNVTTNEVSHYIDGGGARLSLVDNVVTWTHLDHQGSAVAATNASGTKLWEERYLPFGEKLVDPSANQDRPGYTGHVQDSWSGLTYMQARYYDPVLGRFMQTDPIGYQDQLNLYAYVHNDPVNMVDPDGKESWLVRRPVQYTGPLSRGYHLYIVSHVNVEGRDPTVYSWGASGGIRGGKLIRKFDQTWEDDKTHWKGFSSGSGVGAGTGSALRINAPDDLVAELANSAVTDGINYAPFGQNLNPFDDAANSAAAPVAVATEAHNQANPGSALKGAHPLPPSTGPFTVAPGWGDYKDIQFDPDSGKFSGEITRTGSRIARREEIK